MTTNKRYSYIWTAMLAAFLATSVASRTAFAVDELEQSSDPTTFNDPATKAQALEVGSDGTVQVSGGIYNDPTHRDIDFYSFHANEGDVVTINIDGGLDASFVGVNTILAVFGPDGTNPVPLRQTTTGMPIDEPGSVNPFDARIDGFVVPSTGTYVVGVSSEPGTFLDIDHLTSGEVSDQSPPYYVNGTYTLIISGVTPVASAPSLPPAPSAQQIGIDIRPGKRDVIWLRSASRHESKRGHDSDRRHDLAQRLRGHLKGGIPVALLSSDIFNAMDVDQTSLKFGSTGDEDSLKRCNRHGIDVNRDGRPDLVCHFDIGKANFEPGDAEGIVTGTTQSGDAFEGRGFLKIITGKRDWHRDSDRGHRHHRR